MLKKFELLLVTIAIDFCRAGGRAKIHIGKGGTLPDAINKLPPCGSTALCTFLHECIFIHSLPTSPHPPYFAQVPRPGLPAIMGTSCLARDAHESRSNPARQEEEEEEKTNDKK